METLAALRAHTANVRFDERRHCFLVRRADKAYYACRGLTPIVRALLPVARHLPDTPACAGCEEMARLARAAGARRQLHMTPASARKSGPMLQSRKRARGPDGAFECIPTGGGGGATRGEKTPKCYGGKDARAHGRRVDADIDRYLAAPTSLARADPCTVTLLAFLESRLGLVPVASQVPLYSRRLKVATAIDLLCVDASTRTRLHLIEVKATRMTGGATAMTAAACYRHQAATSPPLAGRLAPSIYWQHQLQLWAMASTLRDEYGLVLAGAAVVRTSPTNIFYYPLEDAVFAATSTALVAAFTVPSSDPSA